MKMTNVTDFGAANGKDTVSGKTQANAMTVHGLRITRDLHEAEAALDEALIRQANLLATMVRARRETAVGPFTGQEALLRLAASQKAVLEASGELARVHGKLLAVGQEVRSGLVDDCPAAGSLDDGSADAARPAGMVRAA